MSSSALLFRLRGEVQKFGSVVVSESKYWLTFKVEGGGSFTAINPSKRSLRVFISCDPNRIIDPRGLTRHLRLVAVGKRSIP